MFWWWQTWPILITGILTLYLIEEYEAFSEAQKVMSEEEALIPIRIQEKNLITQITQYREFSFNPSGILQLNLTLDELKNGRVEVNGSSKHFVTSSGKSFPFEEKISSVANLITKTIRVDVGALEGLTFDDLKDDDKMKLDQMPPVKLTPLPKKCELFNLRITSLSSSSSEAFIDDSKIFNYNHGIINKGIPSEVRNTEGILLTAANAHTCQMTFHDLFQTTHFGAFRSLDLTLDSVDTGQLLMVTSLGEGSLLLNETTRTKISWLGSQWSQLYAYRDRWVDVFVKGGRTFIEVIVPNLGNQNKIPSPLFTHVSSPANPYIINCPQWPNSTEWEARRHFCGINEGYKTLCSCEAPTRFPETKSSHGFNVEMDIPIVITASQKRSLNILRLLTTLSRSPGFKKELLLIAFDHFDANTAAIAAILQIETIKCRIDDTYGRTSRIAQMIKCALFHQLLLFQWAQQVILIEDDIVISDDFYEFMQQMIPIFRLDPSVWCVSGFNLFSHPHTSSDPSRLYRSVRHPIWGWMMPTDVLKDILPRWIPHELGIHVDDSIISERNVLSRQLNAFGNVKLQPLQRLKKDVYEQEMKNLIQKSTILEIASTKDFTFPPLQNETYVIYFNKTSPDYDIESSLVRKAFGVYDDVLYDIPEVIQFFYLNCTVLLINHPSDYSKFMSQDYIFFTPSTEEMELFFDDQDSVLRKQEIPRRNHRVKDSSALDLEESLFS